MGVQTMAEYIDKTVLVKRLEGRVKDYGRDCNSNAPIISRTYQAVLHMVENLPTADVVEVVRCKDCKHFLLGRLACIHPYHNGWCNINAFCSYGERRCDNDS